MLSSDNLNISIKDWFLCIKTYYKNIILLCSLFSLIGFFFFTKNHIYFLAQTTFQAQTLPSDSKKMDFISSSLNLLSGQQTNPSKDPFIIKQHNKILTDIISLADLQGEILDNQPSLLTRILNNIYLETAFNKWRLPKELKHLINKHIYIPKAIFNNKPIFSQCQNIEYRGETLKKLKIIVSSTGDFLVFDVLSNSCLGKGNIEKTFFFSEGSFKIKTSFLPRKQKTFSLVLIPLPQSIEILAKNLEITRNPYSHNLFKIQYKHINRHKAKLVVEKTLLAFKKFLEDEEKHKIDKEKYFFYEKEREVYQSIQKELDEQKSLISHKLSDIELEAFSSCQIQLKNINTIKQELRKINFELSMKDNPLYQKLPIKNSFYTELLSSHFLEKEKLISQSCNYKYYLDFFKKNENKFFVPTLEILELNPYISRTENLTYDLFKARTWSENEILHLKNEIQQEQSFLERKIENLLDVSNIKIQSLENQINLLTQYSIQELTNKKNILKQELNTNIQELKNILINKIDQIYNESRLSLLFKQLEFLEKTKHSTFITHSMNYLTSPSTPNIIIPNLPQHPHLIIKTTLTFFASAILIIAYLCAKESLLSPITNHHNLLIHNRTFLGRFTTNTKNTCLLNKLLFEEIACLSNVLEFLPNTPTIIKISGHTLSPFATYLATILKKRNSDQKILVIHIKKQPSLNDICLHSTWNIYSLNDIDHVEINKLSLYSNDFQNILYTYHYIIFRYEISLPSHQLSFSLKKFNNVHIFHISNERLSFIFKLHPETLFISGLETKTSLNLVSILGSCLIEFSSIWSLIKNFINYLTSLKKNHFQEYS